MTPDRRQLLARTAATQEVIDVDGVATSVLTHGEGLPLVLLHGGIECGGVIWTPVLDTLARGHRVIVPDVPGLGESSPVDRLDLNAYATWLIQLLATLDIERPVVVAHSLIGSLTARFAVHHSDALAQLVIFGAPAVGPYRMPWALRYAAIRFAIHPTPPNAERFDRFALLDLDATRQQDPDWFTAFDNYTRARARVKHVKQTMNQLISEQTKPMTAAELTEITTPTTLLWGRHDRMVPLAIGQHAADTCGWPLHIVDGAAHAPQIERPRHFVETLQGVIR